ncbi:hypothetical protein EH196_19230 [Bacillus sp. C1-1]|nr:hypothetical protein EH196_19230 [Bacillus sp. C1-1]
MKNYSTTEYGSLFSLGEEARRLYELKDEIRNEIEKFNFTYLWLPSLTSNNFFHPQKVESDHLNASLTHAGCLPFFEHVDKFENKVYFGFNRVHRLEPLRNLNKKSRLESFEVAEIIVTGTEIYTLEMYTKLKDSLTIFLNNKAEGYWNNANDSFIRKQKKEEWTVGENTKKIAVASGNYHGDYFSGRRNLKGYSFCFGIGLERLNEAIKGRAN